MRPQCISYDIYRAEFIQTFSCQQKCVHPWYLWCHQMECEQLPCIYIEYMYLMLNVCEIGGKVGIIS